MDTCVSRVTWRTDGGEEATVSSLITKAGARQQQAYSVEAAVVVLAALGQPTKRTTERMAASMSTKIPQKSPYPPLRPVPLNHSAFRFLSALLYNRVPSPEVLPASLSKLLLLLS